MCGVETSAGEVRGEGRGRAGRLEVGWIGVVGLGIILFFFMVLVRKKEQFFGGIIRQVDRLVEKARVASRNMCVWVGGERLDSGSMTYTKTSKKASST